MLDRVVFTLACLLLPIAWGVFVNWLFRYWTLRFQSDENSESIYPDYQI